MKFSILIIALVIAVLLFGCITPKDTDNDDLSGDDTSSDDQGNDNSDDKDNNLDNGDYLEPPINPPIGNGAEDNGNDQGLSCTNSDSFRFKSAEMKEESLVAVFESRSTGPLKNGGCTLVEDEVESKHSCYLDDRQAYFEENIEVTVEDAPSRTEIVFSFMRISGAFLIETVICTR